MSSNIFPKNVFKGSNSSGDNFIISEYDFETYATLEFVNLFTLILFGGLISALLSPILFIFIILSFNGRFTLTPIACILFSFYFIVDANHGWIFTNILSFMFDNQQMSILYNIHYGIIYSSFLLLLSPGLLHSIICKFTQQVAMRWIIFIIMLSLVFGIGYMKGYDYTSKQPDWVDKNLGIGVYKTDDY